MDEVPIYANDDTTEVLVKIMKESPYKRSKDITLTVSQNNYKITPLIPLLGFATGGNVNIDSGSADLKVAVIRFP